MRRQTRNRIFLSGLLGTGGAVWFMYYLMHSSSYLANMPFEIPYSDNSWYHGNDLEEETWEGGLMSEEEENNWIDVPIDMNFMNPAKDKSKQWADELGDADFADVVPPMMSNDEPLEDWAPLASNKEPLKNVVADVEGILQVPGLEEQPSAGEDTISLVGLGRDQSQGHSPKAAGSHARPGHTHHAQHKAHPSHKEHQEHKTHPKPEHHREPKPGRTEQEEEEEEEGEDEEEEESKASSTTAEPTSATSTPETTTEAHEAAKHAETHGHKKEQPKQTKPDKPKVIRGRHQDFTHHTHGPNKVGSAGRNKADSPFASSHTDQVGQETKTAELEPDQDFVVEAPVEEPPQEAQEIQEEQVPWTPDELLHLAEGAPDAQLGGGVVQAENIPANQFSETQAEQLQAMVNMQLNQQQQVQQEQIAPTQQAQVVDQQTYLQQHYEQQLQQQQQPQQLQQILQQEQHQQEQAIIMLQQQHPPPEPVPRNKDDRVDWERFFSFIPNGLQSCTELFPNLANQNPLPESFQNAYIQYENFLQSYSIVDSHIGDHLEQFIVYYFLVRAPFIRNVCETGFGAGHSAFLWLQANPDIHVHSFDLGEHEYSRPVADYLMKRFPGRLTVTWGDSVKTLPHFRQSLPTLKCDILAIDGGHTFRETLSDYFHLKQMASNDNIVILDNFPDVTRNYMEVLGNVWEGGKRRGEIAEIFHCDYRPQPHGFSVGRFIVGEN